MTTLLQDTAIWFEEKVVTDLPAIHDNQPVTAGYVQKVTGVDQDRYIPLQGPA